MLHMGPPTASPEDHMSPKTSSPPAYTTLASVPSTSTPIITSPPTSYPAVLVGRPTSSLSDIKPKVPPPVPPRGTPKPIRPGQTNGKGAKHLLYTNGNLVHDLLCLSLNSDDFYCSDKSVNSFVTSIDESDNLNQIFNQQNYTKSLGDPQFQQNFDNNESHYFMPSTKLKRFNKLFDLNVQIEEGAKKSPVKRSYSMNRKYSGNISKLNRHQSIPKRYKKLKRDLDHEKISKKLNENITEKTNKIQIEDERQNKPSTSQEYGTKVKSLKNIFDKSDLNTNKSKNYRSDHKTYLSPKFNAYFAGTSTYLEEQKRYGTIPKIIINASADESGLRNILSPQRNYVEVYNSKRSQKTTTYFDNDDVYDLGELV